jgi:hypothetical protein
MDLRRARGQVFDLAPVLVAARELDQLSVLEHVGEVACSQVEGLAISSVNRTSAECQPAFRPVASYSNWLSDIPIDRHGSPASAMTKASSMRPSERQKNATPEYRTRAPVGAISLSHPRWVPVQVRRQTNRSPTSSVAMRRTR